MVRINLKLYEIWRVQTSVRPAAAMTPCSSRSWPLVAIMNTLPNRWRREDVRSTNLARLERNCVYLTEMADADVHYDVREVPAEEGIMRVPAHSAPAVWLGWNGGVVRRIAEDIACRRAWEELPVLADALQEAGCDNEYVLDHFRRAPTDCTGPSHGGCVLLNDLLRTDLTTEMVP